MTTDTTTATMDWLDLSACRVEGPDVFFPQRQGNRHTEARATAAAKAVCATCPVVDACLDHAIETNEHYGVWGGMTTRERVAEKRRRKRTGGCGFTNYQAHRRAGSEPCQECRDEYAEYHRARRAARKAA
jgi:WhiB family redox-sensing transcriptional regulator